LEDLPGWLSAWCLDHLGCEPADVLFQLQQVSMVFGLRLPGGTDVVVKARADDGRAVSCVAVQALLAEGGFPCDRPLTPVVSVGSLAVHAEEFRPGGEVLHGDSPDVAARYAEVFARLMAELADVTVAPPLPNPPWVRWDHTDSGVWPAPIESSEAFLVAYQHIRGAPVHGRGASDRVGGQLVDGSVQRMGVTPLRHPVVRRRAPHTSSRTPAPGQRL